MGGFLGLIEAFLAFALTMLALSTAVSAIVEVGYNLFRWRAKGLRDMVAYLFRNEIQERLPEYKPLRQKPEYKAPPPKPDPFRKKPEDKKDLAQWKKDLAQWKKTDLAQWKTDLAQWKTDLAQWKKTDLADWEKEKKEWKEWSRGERIDFIFDMTMVPNPQHDTADEEDVRKRQIARAEKYQGILMRKWDNWVAFPKLLLRIINWPFRLLFLWPSLKLGLSNLPAEDFETKFKASTAGMQIKNASSDRNKWEKTVSDRNEWEKTVKAVVDAFKGLEGPTTEHFRRKSRYFSIIVGFALAFAVNIDSFDLLNSYLTDADLRESIIANADTYIKQAQADSIQVLQDSTTPQQFATKIDSLVQALEGISSGGLNEEVQAKLDSAIALVVNESRATAAEMRREIVSAGQQVRSIAGNLTESFPIGWTRYPKCPITSADARCLAVKKRNPVVSWKGGPSDQAQKNFFQKVVEYFWVVITWPYHAVVWAFSYLCTFYANEPHGFFQWLFGVVTTGIMVGLGSPFWLRVVDKLLKLRKGLKGDQKPDDTTPKK